MPTTPRNYQPVPYAAPERYVPSYGTLGELLGLKARNSQQGWAQLANVFNQFVEQRNQQQATKAALAQRKEQQDAELQIKRDEMSARAAERQEADRIRREAAEEKQQLAGEKRGDARAKAIGYGPMSEMDVDTVMQSPERAGDVRYSFGPGMANGPELQPTRDQQEMIGLRKQVEGMGGLVGPNGAVHIPPKPAAPRPQAAMVDGKRVFVFIDPVTHVATDMATGRPVNATPIAPQGAQPPAPVAGNWDLTGDEFLKSIPAQWRKTVEKIAKYDEDPTKVASMRGGSREQLMQWVNQVNPKYDQSQFALRSPTRKAFTIGTQGQQINAINTALGHIDQMDALITQLGNKDFTPGNDLFNWARTTFGSDKVTNFDTLKDALSAEVASVLSKGQATVSEIAEQRKKINSASSPAQLVGYMKTQIPIMGSKLANLDYQYKQAMGDDTFSALSEHSKQILMKHGFDPAHPEIGSQPTKPKVTRDANGNLIATPKGKK